MERKKDRKKRNDEGEKTAKRKQGNHAQERVTKEQGKPRDKDLGTMDIRAWQCSLGFHANPLGKGFRRKLVYPHIRQALYKTKSQN
jgi:hypothetical protein